jgi:hypothetical protein
MSLLPALVASLALAQSLPPWMMGESRPEDLRISLVTFSPGDTLTEWWGHTSLVVEDTKLAQGRLYNYGMFGFDEGFVHRFVQGRLEFWVSDDSIQGTFRLYQFLKRDIRIQELNLTPPQAQQVATALGTNVLPQNRVYLYHHYNDNCSTRPRDIIDRAIGGQLLAYETSQPSPISLRAHTRRYSMVNVPMSLVLDYLQNDELDGPITRKEVSFLPDELERDVQQLKVKRDDGSEVPLVKTQWNVYTSPRQRPPDVPPTFVPGILGFSLALAGLAFALGHFGRDGQRWARVSFGLFHVLLGLGWGVLGVFLFFMGLFTNHTVTHRNENLFFIGPLTFLALPFGVMLAWGARRAKALLRVTWTLIAASSVLGVLVKVLPPFNQDNWNLIALAMPVNLAFAAVFWLDHRRAQQQPVTP